MFARKIRVEYEANGRRQPAPLKWLDSFAMRNFTNGAGLGRQPAPRSPRSQKRFRVVFTNANSMYIVVVS
jgi:hypothetical protein